MIGRKMTTSELTGKQDFSEADFLLSNVENSVRLVSLGVVDCRVDTNDARRKRYRRNRSLGKLGGPGQENRVLVVGLTSYHRDRLDTSLGLLGGPGRGPTREIDRIESGADRFRIFIDNRELEKSS